MITLNAGFCFKRVRKAVLGSNRIVAAALLLSAGSLGGATADPGCEWVEGEFELCDTPTGGGAKPKKLPPSPPPPPVVWRPAPSTTPEHEVCAVKEGEGEELRGEFELCQDVGKIFIVGPEEVDPLERMEAMPSPTLQFGEAKPSFT